MECRWERSRALKRILLQSGFADLDSKARSFGSGYRPSTIRIAAKPSKSSQTDSSRPPRRDRRSPGQEVRNGRIHVQTRDARRSVLRRRAGAMRIPDASAAAATFHSAVIPPTCAMSG